MVVYRRDTRGSEREGNGGKRGARGDWVLHPTNKPNERLSTVARFCSREFAHCRTIRGRRRAFATLNVQRDDHRVEIAHWALRARDIARIPVKRRYTLVPTRDTIILS